MKDLPHTYSAAASSSPDDFVRLESEGLAPIESAPPAEFGGPGDRWSPETLLVAAVADCFILSFKAIARASSLSWSSLACEVEGTLDRVQREMLFTRLHTRVVLGVPADTDVERARKLLEKAERACLITSSLKAECTLSADVEIVR